MSTLLDAILGSFTGGQGGYSRPGGGAPPSGGAADQAAMSPPDPYGNRIGEAASGVPLLRPRPLEAGPAAFSPPGPTSDMEPGESGGNYPGFGPAGPRGLAAALGLDPDQTKTAMASLAGGLSNVKNSPFAGQVAANAAGGAIAGGNQAQDTEINQALKLRQIQQRGLKQADAASAQWYRQRAAALRDELRAINQSTATPEQKAALYKSVQDRGRALAAEFETVKAQNRGAVGLSATGLLLPQIPGSDAREGVASESD
jgi:hypothetical protein